MKNLLLILVSILFFSCKTENKKYSLNELVGNWEMEFEFVESSCGTNGNLITENWTITEKNEKVFLKIDGANIQDYKGALKGNWFDGNMMINTRGPNNQLNRSRISFSLEMKGSRLLEGRRIVQNLCRTKFKVVGKKKN